MDRFAELALFRADECHHIRAKVEALHPHWIRRAPLLPAFTLGAMTYEDATGGRYLRYKLLASAQNAVLRAHFADELETIRCVLEAWLGAPAEFPAWLALPGFHIFAGGVLLTFNPASIHVDTPFLDVHWPDRGKLDVTHPLAFTVCISLPDCGGGLNVWNARPPDPLHTDRDDLAALLKPEDAVYLPYTVGTILLHDGFTPHQIAYRDAEPGSLRITLQGHAVRYDGVWQIFV